MSSIYQINKGVNKSIEFRGLKAQYIWYFAAGVLTLLILFSLLYIRGLNTYLCLALIGTSAVLFIQKLYRWSNTYGEYGMMKKIAKKRTPQCIKSYSRIIFQNLNREKHG